MIKYKLITDFRSLETEKRWEVVADEASGIRSSSELTVTPANTALFEGELSIENNGASASVRTHVGDLFLDMFRGMAIRVKGDGKIYRFLIGTGDTHEGSAYHATFATQQGAWITIHLPFSKFEGSGNPAPSLDPTNICQIGLMIADKQPGPFSLEIEWVKAYLDY
jgi:monofunctional biosynthetic peptidoglycan transglycosylase